MKVAQVKKQVIQKAMLRSGSHQYHRNDMITLEQDIETMLRFVGKYKMKISDLGTALSDVDNTINELLHSVEQQGFDVLTGYKIAKEMQKLRLERRRIKTTLDARGAILNEIEPILQNLTNALTTAKRRIESHNQYVIE